VTNGAILTILLGVAAACASLASADEAVAQQCITNASSGFSRADISGAASNTHLVVTTNDSIGVYRRSDCAVLFGATLKSFFAAAAPTENETLTEPRVIYDFDSKRFFVVAISHNAVDTNQRLLYAVSRDSAGSSWRTANSIILSQGASFVCKTAANSRWSFANAGVNRRRWFVTANNLPASGAATGAILSLDKAKTLVGQVAQFKCFKNLQIDIAPPIVRDTNANAYFLSTGRDQGTTIRRWRLNTAGSVATDALSATSSITIPAWKTSGAQFARQTNGCAVLVGDGRFGSPSIQVGSFLWNVHTINDQVLQQARWRLYKLSTTGTAPLLVHTPDAGALAHHSFNASVATGSTSASARAFVTFTRIIEPQASLPAGAKPSMLIAQGPNASASGWSFGKVAESATEADCALGAPPIQFSQYSATQIDPLSSNSSPEAWGFNQLATGPYHSDWGTRAARVNVADPPAGAVTISGTAREGEMLTASHDLSDADGLGAVSWRWLRGGIEIAGATADTYTPAQADVGAAIGVRASYTDGQGTAESVTSAPTAAVENVNDPPAGAVTISGTAREDETLTASHDLTDDDGLGQVSWQWLRDGTEIAGATADTYTPTQADVGGAIGVRASYTDGQGTAESVTSAPTAAVENVNDVAEISGTATAALSEDGSSYATGGRLLVLDPDSGEAVFQPIAASSLQGTYGSFIFDESTGDWSYTLANDTGAVQALGAGQQVADALVVTSSDGTDAETIEVTVTGTNDAPEVINPIATQNVNEDANWVFSLPPNRSVAALQAFSIDLDTGEVRYAKAPDELNEPASTAKMMTAIVLNRWVEDPSGVVTITSQDLPPPGSTLAGLQAGDQVSYADLLYGLMLPSGNDAANAIGRNVGDLILASEGRTGSGVARFVEEMNKVALEVGASRTTFANPSGLDNAGMKTTARDLATITGEALRNEILLDVWDSPTHTLNVAGPNARSYIVHHTLKSLIDDPDVFGAKGGITTLPATV
jgi:VCBS repeat-containing protein